MLNEYSVSKEYVDFCKEVVEEINYKYGHNGAMAIVDIHEDCVYIKVIDKTGLYESLHCLSKSNMEFSINYNARFIINSAAQYFFNENFN